MHLTTASYFNVSVTCQDVNKVRYATNKDQALDLSIVDKFSDYFFHDGAKKDALSFLWELELQRRTFQASSQQTAKGDALRKARDAYTNFRGSVLLDYREYVPENQDEHPTFLIQILNKDGTMAGFVFDFPDANDAHIKPEVICPELETVIVNLFASDGQELSELETIARRDWPLIRHYFENEDRELVCYLFVRLLETCEKCRTAAPREYLEYANHACTLFWELKKRIKDIEVVDNNHFIQSGNQLGGALSFVIWGANGESSLNVLRAIKYKAYAAKT